jgi:hypothetical protein
MSGIKAMKEAIEHELPPPDLNQCESVITPAYSFMTLGRPSPRRCTNLPAYVAKENQTQRDGQRGSMSVCEDCAAELQRKMPGYATLTSIPPTHNLD